MQIRRRTGLLMKSVGILTTLAYATIAHAQISTIMYAGPNNDGTDTLEICVAITNSSNSNITLFRGQEQIIVVQFGDAPILGDNTATASCLRADQFVVIDSLTHPLVTPGSASTARSDIQDFEIAFRLETDLTMGPGDTWELFCSQNTNITGSCENLVYLLDCAGTQFTIFNNGAIMPRGTDDCTEGFAQQCNPNLPDALQLSLEKIDLSCPSGSDGMVIANLAGGVAPYTFMWNNGDSLSTITDLSGGIYAVTLSDDEGCLVTGSITIEGAEPITIETTSQPSCMSTAEGSASARVVSGGQPPYRYLWDENANDQSTSTASNIAVGTYSVTVTDANDCAVFTTVEVGSLSTDTIAVICTEVSNSFINFDWADDPTSDGYEVSLNDGPWEASNFGSSHGLSGLEEGQIVNIQVRSSRDCLPAPMGSATCRAFVYSVDNSIYAPNVFSPNDDLTNDRFVIYGEPGVIIEELRIFDRSGNIVFQRSNITPGDASMMWDGTLAGKIMRPQVFAHYMKIRFPDGTSDVMVGDVTLVR